MEQEAPRQTVKTEVIDERAAPTELHPRRLGLGELGKSAAEQHQTHQTPQKKWRGLASLNGYPGWTVVDIGWLACEGAFRAHVHKSKNRDPSLFNVTAHRHLISVCALRGKQVGNAATLILLFPFIP